ncbi:MAG TPA: hypothetical protein VGK74_19425 [Symbiobacteriaceae bacterium]|jgi:hypothetical protein
MSVKAILQEILALLQQQVADVVAGDHLAVRAGAERYELLMAQLEQAEIDLSPAELKPLYDDIQQEKTKLQSLLSVEVNRVEFLLRLLVGSGSLKPIGYPGKGRSESGSRMFNRRA